MTPLVLMLIVCLLAAGYWVGAFLTAFIGLAAMAIREEFRKLDEGSGYLLFPVIIAGFAFLIGVGVEFVRVGGDIGRMNTLFKFYLEGWILMALAAAISLWYLARHGIFSLGRLASSSGLTLVALVLSSALLIAGVAFWIGVRVEWSQLESPTGRLDTLYGFSVMALALLGGGLLCLVAYLSTKGASYLERLLLPKALWMTLLGVFLFSSFIYTALGTRARLSDRFDTQEAILNGESFLSRSAHQERDTTFELKWDYDAIKWLRNNVQGSPVVLEAHTSQYRWGGRMANYTGLPTVLGWPWHQEQQRGGYAGSVAQRASAIKEVYSTPDPQQAMELLKRYDVRYVVVGDLERIFYPQLGLEKFMAMVDRGLLQIAYRNPGTTIYEVTVDSAPTISSAYHQAYAASRPWPWLPSAPQS